MLRNNWVEREQSMTMFNGKKKDPKIAAAPYMY
jgi:hypothetical protein